MSIIVDLDIVDIKCTKVLMYIIINLLHYIYSNSL